MSNKKQHDEEHSKIYKVWLWVKRWWLPIAILLITSIGLACALSIPQRVFETPREPANDKSAPVLLAQSNLRLAFLYITGGAIAVVGLIETFRKNNNEKLKNDQDKEKNDREHLRQVRADRREQYTKAVEQLGDEKAPVRMGGVYTLVGLVDEWLEEESLSEEERLKEGQVIINNLCAYIRSPFTLASQYDFLSQNRQKSKNKFKKFIRKNIQRNFYISKAKLQAEADIRLSIIKEIHDRLQEPEENAPGTWSDFEYDFSGSTFFYPVDLTKSYYKKTVNFGGSTYHNEADFSESTYHNEADFHGSTYHNEADFHGSTYHNEADFSESIYHRGVDFSESIYHRGVDFHGSTYHRGVDFHGSTYHRKVYFGESTYHRGAYFGGSTYQWADFHSSTYYRWVYFGGSTYHNEADFHGSTYQRAYFSDSAYHRWANFHGSTYTGWADFSNSIYENWTDFNESIFYQETYFGKDGYSSFSRFTNYAPHFYDKTNNRNTLFGSHNNDFTVDTNEGYPIVLNSEGLPIGCNFLTSEQKEYLEGKLQEIEKINNKLREVKDPKEKAELSKNLQALDENLYEWREEATTVKVEGTALGEEDN